MIHVRDHLLVFFTASPDEELTRADVVARSGAHPSTVHDSVSLMVADGLLGRVRRGRTYHYVAGPVLLKMRGTP